MHILLTLLCSHAGSWKASQEATGATQTLMHPVWLGAWSLCHWMCLLLRWRAHPSVAL